LEIGLADVLTLCFIFTALLSGATLLLLWADFPFRSAREREMQLRCELLYFSLLNLKPENSEVALPQAVVENLLGLPTRGFCPENLALEALRCWVREGWCKVEISLGGRKWEVQWGRPTGKFYRSRGGFSFLPAHGDPLRAEMEVELG
jgi:hypothetical protein